MWQLSSIWLEPAALNSPGVTTLDAAAMSHRLENSDENPELVPLDSNSSVIPGCCFLYSAIRRGANSSPIVFEPLMTTFPLVGRSPDGFFSEQPAKTTLERRRPVITA